MSYSSPPMLPRQEGRRSRARVRERSTTLRAAADNDRPLVPLPRAVRAWFLGQKRSAATKGFTQVFLRQRIRKEGGIEKKEQKGEEKEEEDYERTVTEETEHNVHYDDDENNDDDEYQKPKSCADDDAEDAFESAHEQAVATVPWLKSALVAGIGTQHGSEHDEQATREARRLLGSVPSFARCLDEFSLFGELRAHCEKEILKLSRPRTLVPKLKLDVRQDSALVGIPLPPHSAQWGEDASNASEFTEESVLLHQLVLTALAVEGAFELGLTRAVQELDCEVDIERKSYAKMREECLTCEPDGCRHSARPRPAVAGIGALCGRCICASAKDAERALRNIAKGFHIVAQAHHGKTKLSLAILFRSRCTYSTLCLRSRAAWNRYLSHPSLTELGGSRKSRIEKGIGEASRWRSDVTQALKHLRSSGIAAVDVSLICCIDIVTREVATAEPVLCFLKQISRAESAYSLFQELCLSRGLEAEVMKISLEGDAVSLSGLVAGLNPCLVDTVDFDDRTPLFLACAKGNLGCVKVLLAAGAVADRVSADGRTPLQAAVEAGHAKVVAELIVTSRVLSGTLLVEYWEDVERSKRVAEEENNEIESKENSEARELKRELERRRADLAGPRKRILHEVEIDLEDYVFVSLPKVDVERETYDGSTPLHSAIARGYQQVVQVLLRPGGASVNRVTTSGETPLNVVAKSGHYEFVALLLARGAVDKEAALLTAVGKGDTRMVDELLAHGGDYWHCRDRAMILAIKQGHAEVARQLITAGFDANVTSTCGTPALVLAVENGDAACARALLEGNASLSRPNTELETPTLAACLWNEDVILQLFLSSDFTGAATVVQDRVRSRRRPKYRGKRGRQPVSPKWKKKGFNEGKGKSSASEFELMPDEHRAILSAILDRRVPINIADERGTTPLMWAAFEGYPDAVQKLLEAGAKIGDTNKKGETTFDVAVKAGQREVLSVLLEHNDPADFNLDEIMGGGKTTALVFSASCGRADIISVLLQAGADPTIKDSRGLPPLLAAVRHGQSEAVSTLLRSDFCEELVTSSDYGKIPLLIRAVKGGFADVVSALLAGGFGTNVDQRDPHGATALHWACSKGYASTALNLVRAGASLRATDSKNLMPLEVAQRSGHDIIVRQLTQP